MQHFKRVPTAVAVPVLVVALVTAGCGPARPGSGGRPDVEGAVLLESVQAQIVRVEGNNIVVLAAGDYVEPSQIIETWAPGGAAALKLPDGRRVLLAAGSRLRLASLAPATASGDAEWAFLDFGSLHAGPSYDSHRPVVVGTPRGPLVLDRQAPIEVLGQSRR